MVLYLIIAVSFWYYPVSRVDSENAIELIHAGKQHCHLARLRERYIVNSTRFEAIPTI